MSRFTGSRYIDISFADFYSDSVDTITLN